MTSLSGNYSDGYKFYKNENGDICFRNIDGSYLSVAKSMPFDKLLELENKGIPEVDCIVECKYRHKYDKNRFIIINNIKCEKSPVIIKPYFKKANKKVRGKNKILDFCICSFCGTHHADDTYDCADCISNYERDMKYTYDKIFEISNNDNIGIVTYNSIMININKYRHDENFRGFRYIDISIGVIFCDITMYFLDSNNRMIKHHSRYDLTLDDEDYDEDYDEYESSYNDFLY